MSNTINSAGLALIKEWEGLRLNAYQCAAGVWTIGYGHTGTVDGKKIKKGMTITRSKADKLLQEDVAEFWDYVNNPYYVPLIARMGENQKAALTSFAFNCGANNLKTLCKNRSLEEIADAILLYNKAGGKVNAGLVARRKAEQKLYKQDMEVTHDMDTLRKNDKGQQVRVLQILLNGALGCSLDVDGIFGSKTESATKCFQREHDLDADGIAGPKTWGEMLA